MKIKLIYEILNDLVFSVSSPVVFKFRVFIYNEEIVDFPSPFSLPFLFKESYL